MPAIQMPRAKTQRRKEIFLFIVTENQVLKLRGCIELKAQS